MKKVLREVLGSVAQGVGGTVLVVGVLSMLLANRFWLADLLVNFQVHFVVCLLGCLFLLVILRRQLTAAVFVLGTVFLALPIIPYLKVPFQASAEVTPTDEERVYRLMTYNVFQSNTRVRDITDYIASARVDFLLVLETDKVWSDELDFELRDHFPHRFTEPRSDCLGVTFYSKLPWKEIKLIPGMSFPAVEATFSLPEGKLTVMGAHPLPPIRPPSADARNVHLEALATHAEGISGGVILAGDLNVTPWSPYFQGLLQNGDLVDTAVGRGLQNTWHRLPILMLGLPIDHVLTRDVAAVRRTVGPPISSDHRPLLVDFLVRITPDSQ